MELNLRSKAFFVNGGAGRMVCSIPAFEKYEQESNDKDFIIVCEGGAEVFKGHPTLDKRVYDHWHRNIFQDKLKDMDIFTTEPYRVWEYYNQQCSIAQAFDIQINNKGIRELPIPTIKLSKDELLQGRYVVSEVKKKLKKDKVIVFQPFGRGVEYIDETLVDKSGRSFELKDVKEIIRKLQEKGFAVILMSEFKVDFSDAKLKDEIATPENLNLRVWAAVIKFSDHLLGCDSVGQHLAVSMGTKVTSVIGSTYPINVSYPNHPDVDILDMGEIDREYSPIRIVIDERVDRKNEPLMVMTKEIQDLIVDHVIGKKE